MSRSEWLSAAAYAIALVWINFYICRDLLVNQTVPMNSMHGFWAAIAQRAGSGWFQPDWWRFWDCGIPFEFTYSPLVPALTAIGAAVFRVSYNLAFQFVTVLAYCLGPLTLFLMAWLMTRAPGYSFLAGLFYSLVSPTQILVPDAAFQWRNFWDARRLYLMVTWDDTPHLLGLVFLPLAILFLSLSFRRRRLAFYVGAIVSIAAATAATAFAPVVVVMVCVCLLFVSPREEFKRNVLITLGIGAYAYALSAHFLPPSLLHAMHTASERSGDGSWTMGSVTALSIITLGWVLLVRFLPRWTGDWRLQFFVLFTYLTSSVPMLADFLNRVLLPQPSRYKFEMELAWALLAVFAARCWIDKMPREVKAALLFVFLAFAGQQIVSHRRFAKNSTRPGNFEQTIEYRAATWASQNLPGTRMLLPGSIAQWANAFTPIEQFTGGSWSMAYNPIQQLAAQAVYAGGETPEQDARVSQAWLEAYGVGAVCVSGPKSPETWKPYRHPDKFEGRLPVLWRADDTTIYQVPQLRASFAHVVPESAVVAHAPRGSDDLAEIDRYISALDDPSLPAAEFQWEGNNRIRIRTTAKHGQVITIQVSYHPGWHAAVGNRHLETREDGLGLMWVKPECDGPCEVRLEYDGGWELRVCRWLSYLALGGLLIGLPVLQYRRRRSFGRRVD